MTASTQAHVISLPKTAVAPDAGDVVDMNDARPRRWGWWLVIFGLGGFLAWAALAPLDAGVPTQGMVVVSGHRKAVQPLVGGKISAILVKDGDEVTPGQVLVRLDDTQARSQYEIAIGQWFTAAASEARLTAERLGKGSISFPVRLRNAHTDPRALQAMQLQTQLFATRRQALESDRNILRESIRGLEAQLAGIEEATRARKDQQRLLEGEIARQRELADKGFLARNRVSEQERALAALTGAIAEDAGNIGHTRQQIAELKARLLSREQEYRKEVESQLADVQREASTLESRLQALEFELANTEIRSPAEGVVVGLAVHTVGGVVGTGNPMMEVVPKNEPLRVEAQIAPHLIDKVRPGLEVDILFSAFQQATTPHVPGHVTDVSADVLNDPKSNQPYYKAVVEVTADGMAKLKQHRIRAGMPAEVFIRTGERTLMNYLTKPLLDRMNRALTEP
jgi:protease secretion system membrane fusion protein